MQSERANSRIGYLLAAAALLLLALVAYRFDHTIATTLHGAARAAGPLHPAVQWFGFVRPFGKGEIALLVVSALGLCGARRQAVRVLYALAIMTVLVWTFKLAIGRQRPNQGDSESFPSGDVATAAVVGAALAPASPWAIPVGTLATLAVAAGRLCDGKHFPSDVLAGAAFGIFAAGLACRWRPRRLPRSTRWLFLLLGLLVIAVDIGKLPWANALPYGLAFLGLWGPAAFVLLVARLGPTFVRVWRRQRRTPSARTLAMAGIGGALVLYVLLTTASTLWDRDEPRFARATVEMVSSGDYLVPTFNGALRPDKPILIYWLMSLPVRLFGQTELACRMVAPLATLVACLLTFWAGARIAGPLAGALAAIMLAFSPLMAVSGTAATTDALLLACMTAAIGAFLLSWTRGVRLAHVALLALALGGALLTKGPVGLAVPLLVIGAILGFVRGGAVRPRAYLPWLLLAVAVATGCFLAWGLPANWATGGEFWRRGVGHHVVDRSMAPMESHGGKSILYTLYYLPVILFAFFPWTLYLPHGLRSALAPSSALALPARRVLLCWAAPVIVLMSLVATKLPHYVLPAWPALAIVAAIGAQHAQRERRRPTGKLATRLGLGLFTVAGLTLGLGLAIAPWLLPLGAARLPAVSMGLVFLTMTVVGWWTVRRGRHVATMLSLVAGMTMILTLAAFRLLPALEAFKISPRVAAEIVRHVAAPTPVATCGYGEPSLNFYLHRGAVHPLAESDLADWAGEPGDAVLVTTTAVLARQKEALASPRIQALAGISGFNYSQGKWIKAIILLRNRM